MAKLSWGFNQNDVVINELAWMGNASSTADEWIEFKNMTDAPIDLTGWTLKAQDDSPEIVLVGTISSQGYFLLERTDNESAPGVTADQIYTGALEDQGEFLTLRDSASTTIFSLDALSGWPAGSTITRETMQWTGSAWITATGTPKAENSVGTTPPPDDEEENPPEEPEATSTPVFYPSDVVINEFSADANEGEKEWLEFFNNTTSTIDLAGSTIEDATGKILDLSGEISAGGFLVIEISASKLNNDGDIIILKNPDETIIDQIDYEAAGLIAAKGESVARKIDGADTNNDASDFALTITPTKSAVNIITPRPAPPPSSGGGGGGGSPQNQAPLVEIPAISADYSNFKIVINEIFPNPAGSDDNDEFIELKNIGETTVDLKNWFLKDASGKKYVIGKGVASTTIDIGKILVIKRSESGIALNNTGRETVDLYSPDGKVIAHLEYNEKDTEDRSYSRDEKGNYFWTEKITPDAENIIEVKEFLPPVAVIGADAKEAEINQWIEFSASESVEPNGAGLKYLWNWGDGKTSNREMINHRFGAAGEYKVVLTVTSRESGLSSQATSTVFIASKSEETSGASSSSAKKSTVSKTGGIIVLNSLDEIRSLDTGSAVKARGVVAVEPGVLGTQIFYLNGAQIYSYKKDFPNLKPGDFVEVSGEISESGGERRIKIASRSDIKILEQKDAPVPPEILNGDVGEENEGSLVKISGQVLEKKGNYIYLDDGDSEATVYLKSAAGINTADIKAGDFLNITGIVSQTKTGYRILPRYQSDIVKGEVKGVAEVQTSKPAGWWDGNIKYFIAIIVFLIIVIAYLFWQVQKLKKSGWQVVEDK